MDKCDINDNIKCNVNVLLSVDKSAVLAASLRSAADQWGLAETEVNISMMLSKGQILAAVGTLSYMNEVVNRSLVQNNF